MKAGTGSSGGQTTGVSVEIERLSRTYFKGQRIEVLRDVSLALSAGERVAIVGPSGSGKSTFLHAVGLLDEDGPRGRIHLDGQDVTRLSEPERAAIRSRRIGFVFQAHHLLPEHSALGNVMVPVRLAGGTIETAQTRARALLVAVGLAERLDHRPGELSGGEQQRVAIARALVMGPGLVLADEPTGNLDRATGDEVVRLLEALNARGVTLIVVTHDPVIGARARRRIRMEDGAVVQDTEGLPSPQPLSREERGSSSLSPRERDRG